MKTFIEFLNEAWHSSMAPASWSKSKEQSDVYQNPSRSELKGVSNHGSAPMFLHGDNAYTWDRYKSGLHAHAAGHIFGKDHEHENAIPVEVHHDGKEAYFHVTDYSKKTKWHHSPDVKSAIENHPWVKKNFKKVDVGYYDHDIEGDWHE